MIQIYNMGTVPHVSVANFQRVLLLMAPPPPPSGERQASAAVIAVRKKIANGDETLAKKKKKKRDNVEEKFDESIDKKKKKKKKKDKTVIEEGSREEVDDEKKKERKKKKKSRKTEEDQTEEQAEKKKKKKKKKVLELEGLSEEVEGMLAIARESSKRSKEKLAETEIVEESMEDLVEESIEEQKLDEHSTESFSQNDALLAIEQLDISNMSTEQYVDEFSDIQNSDYSMSERVSKLKKLLFTPVPEGASLQCHMDRVYDHSGQVSYSLIMPIEEDDRRMILMMAKLKTGSVKPTYILSLESNDFTKKYHQRSTRYFGKLQCLNNPVSLKFGLASTFKYVLYDDGYNGKKKSAIHGMERKEYLSVIHASKVDENLEVTVGLPLIDTEVKGKVSENHALATKARIYESFDDEWFDEIESNFISLEKIPMGNKKRLLCSKDCKFPIAPSDKNMELKIKGEIESEPALGMARIGNERFYLTAQYPLSPFQAFGVAISQFDYCKHHKSKFF